MRISRKAALAWAATMLALLAVSCGGSAATATTPTDLSPTTKSQTSAPTPTATSEPTATPAESSATFPEGIWFREPRLNDPGARIVSMDGDELVPGLEIPPGGFDLTNEVLVFPSGDDSLMVVTPNGDRRTVRAEGLYTIARPSLSPDSSRVAVQASEKPGAAFGTLHIYVIDLSNGSWERLSRLRYEANEESPEWFPGLNRIAFSSFSPDQGVNLHVIDLDDSNRETVFPEKGAIHLAITPNGNFVLDPGRMRIYDTARGDLYADLSFQVLEELKQAGYGPDTRFPGQADRGTFPLDGSFSPDAESIVFDGAVDKDGEYGVSVARIDVDGSGFEILAHLIPANPEFTNQHNYSQLNPVWMGE